MTTYHVLVLQRTDEEPLWRYLGEVEATDQDAARGLALGRENIDTAPAVAIPDRSWKPEVFTAEPQPRKYVKASAVAASAADAQRASAAARETETVGATAESVSRT